VKALRPRIENISSSGDIVMVKHDMPRPFAIVQLIDVPVASGDRDTLLE
jgi:hypothetical protein